MSSNFMQSQPVKFNFSIFSVFGLYVLRLEYRSSYEIFNRHKKSRIKYTFLCLINMRFLSLSNHMQFKYPKSCNLCLPQQVLASEINSASLFLSTLLNVLPFQIYQSKAR